MSTGDKSIVIFENDPIRRIWSEEKEKWYFSIVDVIAVLIGQKDHRRAQSYWTTLKNRLKNEGSEVVTNCDQMKIIAKDGKKRPTDVADTEALFRIIQTIPSPKAEPFKLWLAKVGYERLREAVDPEMALNRARENWQILGRSKQWIEQRMRGQEIRSKLTDHWSDHEISEKDDFARLTNVIHREWSGITVKDHKNLKNLRGHNLRDSMTEAELLFSSLAELATRQVAEKDRAVGYYPNEVAAIRGGRYAGKAKNDFEKVTGRKVVSKENFLPPTNKKKRISNEKAEINK